MTTTIQCTYHIASANCSLVIEPQYGPGNVGLTVTRGNDKTEVVVPTADLLAALDATANTDVADKCLAYAANVAESRDEWKACAERWAESKESWKADAAEWQTRAEKAEAAVERVRELAERWRTPELLAALDPKPAFTLPTEAGVRFTAKRTGWPDDASEFVTLSDGNGKAFYFIPDDPDGYTDEESRIWPAEGVMSKWTDHRLIGAES